MFFMALIRLSLVSTNPISPTVEGLDTEFVLLSAILLIVFIVKLTRRTAFSSTKSSLLCLYIPALSFPINVSNNLLSFSSTYSSRSIVLIVLKMLSTTLLSHLCCSSLSLTPLDMAELRVIFIRVLFALLPSVRFQFR